LSPDEIAAIKAELAEADAMLSEHSLHGPSIGTACITSYGLDRRYGEGTRYYEQLYTSYTNDELLFILRARGEINGMPPKYNQALDVLRSFITLRYLDWSRALQAAGWRIKNDRARLVENAVHHARIMTTDDEVLLCFYTVDKCREYPHPAHEAAHVKALNQLYDTYRSQRRLYCWQAVSILIRILKYVRTNKRLLDGEQTTKKYGTQIAQLRDIADTLGRTPIIAEVPDRLGMELCTPQAAGTHCIRCAVYIL
jgi:hypothetical protein